MLNLDSLSINNMLAEMMYFLALINPISKVLMLSTDSCRFSWEQVKKLSLRANLTASVIVVLLSMTGDFALKKIFHVEVYSLQIVGGLILFFIGMLATNKGKFHRNSKAISGTDISLVPLAIPMIAGPGTIVAVITLSVEKGICLTLGAFLVAIFVNLIVMLLAFKINLLLVKIHVVELLTRLMGLIIASVAVQMILNGLSLWLNGLLNQDI